MSLSWIRYNNLKHRRIEDNLTVIYGYTQVKKIFVQKEINDQGPYNFQLVL